MKLFLIIINSELFDIIEHKYIYSIIIVNILGILAVCFAVIFKSRISQKTDTKIKLSVFYTSGHTW